MRNYTVIFLMSVGVLPGLWAQDVAAPQVRMQSITTVKELLTTKPMDDSDEDLNARNPFNPVKPVEVTDSSAQPASVVVTNGTSDREKLQRIVDGINPSGTMQLGDEALLLFGQKKFKVGDILPIIFEGGSYELKITAIERISFTLRLNNEEITRPIKPVANKP
jgi:ABC-type antimicrobial peptide transport system ATPase subunit